MNGASFITWKLKDGYSPGDVVSELFAIRKSRSYIKSSSNNSNVETTAQRKHRLSERIYSELNKFSIGNSYAGRELIHTSILYDLLDEEKIYKKTAFRFLETEKNMSSGHITNNIQTAINHAWDTVAPEELDTLYPYNTYKSGTPRPVEFISNLSDKIKKNL